MAHVCFYYKGKGESYAYDQKIRPMYDCLISNHYCLTW
jgi:hypothetical protein